MFVYILTDQLRGSLTPQDVQRIKRDLTHIIKEKRHMMKYVVEGYYNMETRF